MMTIPNLKTIGFSTGTVMLLHAPPIHKEVERVIPSAFVESTSAQFVRPHIDTFTSIGGNPINISIKNDRKLLEELKETTGLTWEELAATLDLSPRFLHMVRRGERRLGEYYEVYEGLSKLFARYDVSPILFRRGLSETVLENKAETTRILNLDFSHIENMLINIKERTQQQARSEHFLKRIEALSPQLILDDEKYLHVGTNPKRTKVRKKRV